MDVDATKNNSPSNIQSRVALQEMLVRLEKDFKYNLTLLQIRDAEIERCTETNRTLRETLTVCLNTNGELKARIGLLEAALNKSTTDKAKEREIYREKLVLLMKNLGESKHERDIYEHEREIEVQRRVLEVEKNYVQLLNRRQTECDKKVEEIQARLEDEMITVAKLKRQAENSLEESAILRNKLRETQTKCAREASIYRNELNTLRRSNDALNSTITNVRREVENRRAENDTLKQRLREYKGIDSQLRVGIETLTKENETLRRANAKLNDDFMNCKNASKKLTIHIDEPGEDTRGVGTLSSDDKINCPISEHKRFPLLLKQNEVLQEIVKTMRKEREMLTQKQTEELRRAEGRVDKLENVIDSLKCAVVSNVNIPNVIPIEMAREKV